MESKRMRRRTFIQMGALTSLGAALVACTPKPTPTPKAPAKITEPTPVPKPPTAAPSGKVTWATWGGSAQEELYKQAITKFQADVPGVQVENINTANFNDHTTKIQTMIAGGTPPDVIMMGGEWIPMFADKGVFADLTPYIEKDKSFSLDDYYANLLDAMKYKAKIYALPKDFNITCLFYNKDAFDKVGLKYPTRDWTWNDLLEAAKKLTVSDAAGRVSQYGLFGSNPWFWIWQNGGKAFDNEQDPKTVLLTEPAALEAMQWYYDLALKHKVSPTDAELSQGGGRQEFFAAGRLAMLCDHRGATVPFAKITAFKWDIVELPTGKQRATTLNTAGYGISPGTKNPDGAWALAKWLSGPGGNRVFVSGGNALPGVKSLVNDPSLGVQKPFIDAIAYARPYFASSKWGELNPVLTAETQLIAAGSKSVEQGCKDIKAKLEPILK